MADETTPASARRDAASLGEVIETVKGYARSETIGPLKGAGRWIGMGAAGAACLGIGLSLMLLGLLRMLQTESFGFSTDHYSWANYLIVLVVCGILIGLTVWRINKKYLNKEDQP